MQYSEKCGLLVLKYIPSLKTVLKLYGKVNVRGFLGWCTTLFLKTTFERSGYKKRKTNTPLMKMDTPKIISPAV